MNEVQQIITGLNFDTEADAWAHFDTFVERSKAFRIHREVPGEYIHPRVDTVDKSARIDRLLIPLNPAVQAGWTGGAIGVEGKRSDPHVGRLVAQAMDYSRCVFELEAGVPGLLLMLRWVFVYPIERQIGDIESLMAQNRIGYVRACNRSLAFACGGMNGIVITSGGDITVQQFPMGKKRGSR